ncbi:ABC transporter ATP-binding protein [Floridanema evergladense]|uniref:ABC transporter ATP-binding protein n=1 Tax=Floridaenema evergladense BLCC-F167 TaxID=3153639 RepID=A0ABV4WPY4_9CYAN
MTDTVLDVRNLQVQFLAKGTGRTPVVTKAVDGISFQVKPGQTLGIVGESGSGKSVTSLAIMGLVPSPSRVLGEIWFQGSGEGAEAVNLLQLPERRKQQYRGGEIAMIFQEPMSSLNPVYTIGFQITEAIRLHQNVSEAQARRLAVSLLQEVKLLPSDEDLRQGFLEIRRQEQLNTSAAGEWAVDISEKEINQYINQQKLAMLDRYPHELSGGQMQRVMIAMAISCNPKVLIADEPTTALDVTVQATILELLRELCRSRGMSMIFITHDLGVIAEIADIVAVMYRGKIVEYGLVWQIFSAPQHPYTKGLLACRPSLDRNVRYLPTVSDFMEVVETDDGEWKIEEKSDNSNQQIGVSSTPFPVSRPHSRVHTSDAPILSVKNLQVGFPVRGMFGKTERYIMAVNGISFDVYKSETLGLVGESGCGKTTLARTLLRLIEPMGGQIFFEGRDITNLKGAPLQKLRREMQIVFQNPFSSLDPRMNIGDAVMEPLRIHEIGKKDRERRDRAAYLLEKVGLNPDWMKRYPHEFSGGQRQRICIARALALNPKFIICDESVSALDVSVQAQVLNLLKEIQQEFGLTYIFISHDLSVVKFMSDRIMVMNSGKIEEIDIADMIYRQPKTEYTRQLINSIPTGSLARIKQRQQQRSIAM